MADQVSQESVVQWVDQVYPEKQGNKDFLDFPEKWYSNGKYCTVN